MGKILEIFKKAFPPDTTWEESYEEHAIAVSNEKHNYRNELKEMTDNELLQEIAYLLKFNQ